MVVVEAFSLKNFYAKKAVDSEDYPGMEEK